MSHPGVSGVYGVNRLYKVAQAQADAAGNATFTFDSVASGQVWTGSIFCQAGSALTSLFTVFVDTRYVGQFQGGGSLTGVQAADGSQVTVMATALFASQQATMVWIGSVDQVGQASVALPFVSGPSGIQTVVSNPLFPLDVTAVRTDTVLATSSLQALAGGASATVFNGAVTGISYQVAVDALGVAAPVTPFMKVSFIWKDAAGGNTLDIQHWFPLLTNNSPASGNGLVQGRGPSESPFLTVIITNLDTSAITYDFELLGCSVPLSRHDWRSVSNSIAGSYTFGGQTFTSPVSDMGALFAGNSGSLSIPAGGSQARVNGIYAGKAQLSVTQSVLFAGQVSLYLVQPEFPAPLQLVYQAPYPASLVSLNVPDLALTRSPSVVVFTNTSGAPQSLAYALIPEEFTT